MNTLKVTAIGATLLTGSIFLANSPVNENLFFNGKQLIIKPAPASSAQQVTLTTNIPDDTLANKKQQLSLNQELGIINFKKAAVPGIVFRIQVLSSQQQASLKDKAFSGLPEVREYFYDGLYKYTVGRFKTPQESEQMFYELDDRGFTDAFMVAFKDDKPIPVKQAMKAIRK